MSHRKDWTKEFAEMANRDESPEVKTGQILDLIAERDELKEACEAALSLLQNIGSGKWAKTPAGDKLRKALREN